MYEKIDDKRYEFYETFLINKKWKKDIDYISTFINNYNTNLIKKIETCIIPSLALYIFKRKQLKLRNIYNNYFTPPYSHLLKKLNNHHLLAMVNQYLESFIMITKSSLEKAINDLKHLNLMTNEDAIKEASIELGDLHSNHIMTILITLKNNKKFLLKPSPCEPSDCFYKICDELNDGTDEFTVKYRKLSNYKSHNRIYDKSGVIRAENYLNPIEKSFKETMKKIIINKSKLKTILNKKYIDEFNYRYIIRPTAFYQFIYVRSWQPSELEDKEAYWCTITKKLNNSHIASFNNRIKKQIIDSEISALKQGLIPFFYRDGNSNNLFDLQNNTIKNAFSTSIFKNIQTKLDKIDDNYIKENIQTLRNYLNSSKDIDQQKLNNGWII